MKGGRGSRMEDPPDQNGVKRTKTDLILMNSEPNILDLPPLR
jgi:hypothetical protein